MRKFYFSEDCDELSDYCKMLKDYPECHVSLSDETDLTIVRGSLYSRVSGAKILKFRKEEGAN